MELGDAYLRKPVSKNTLLKKLSQFLEYSIEASEENTEGSIAAASVDFFSQEALLKLLEELDTTWFEQWKNRDVFSIGDFETWGEGIINLGETYQYQPLLNWGRKVCFQANSFDVDSLEKTLKEFPAIVDKIRSLVV